MSDLYTILEGAGAVSVMATALFAAYFRASKSKDEKLEASKTETITIITANRDAWKEKWETENSEYKAYRDNTHLQINDANAKLLRCTEDNATLKIKTDMTPVLQTLKQINDGQLALANLLNAITTRLEKGCPMFEKIGLDRKEL